MKTARVIPNLFAALMVLVLGLAVSVALAGEGGVVTMIKNASAPFDPDHHVQPQVVPLEHTVVVSTGYPGKVLRTQTRKDQIRRFACSQCHNNKPVTVAQAAQMAHGRITLIHGGPEKSLSCFTCHNKEARDYLVTEEDAQVDMDHSYQLCGQCHFRQKKDWVGGAHGKRVANWAGTRVVKNCTACHDPHKPRFARRWPKTYSRPSAR